MSKRYLISSHTHSNSISLIFGDRAIFKIMQVRQVWFLFFVNTYCGVVMNKGVNESQRELPPLCFWSIKLTLLHKSLVVAMFLAEACIAKMLLMVRPLQGLWSDSVSLRLGVIINDWKYWSKICDIDYCHLLGYYKCDAAWRVFRIVCDDKLRISIVRVWKSSLTLL